MKNPLDIFKPYKLLLASHSPRRRELMAMLGLDFCVAHGIEVDESYPADMPTAEVPAFLSRKKALAYADILDDNAIIITADTVVIINGIILGKPTDEADAKAMLHMLSDNTHTVVSGVTIMSTTKSRTFSSATEVTFAELTDEMIDYYVTKYRPLDKAGAYGIQEWIGGVGIKGINGSYYNVMGLPACMLFEELIAFVK